jgi:hypothetical protein
MQVIAQKEFIGMRATDLWCILNNFFFCQDGSQLTGYLMCNRVLVFCLFVVWVNSFLFQKWVQGWQPCMVGCSTNWCVGIAKQAWTCTAVCYAKERGSIARQKGGNILHIWWNVSIIVIHDGFYGDKSTDVCWKSACIWIFGNLKHVTDNVFKKMFFFFFYGTKIRAL